MGTLIPRQRQKNAGRRRIPPGDHRRMRMLKVAAQPPDAFPWLELGDDGVVCRCWMR